MRSVCAQSYPNWEAIVVDDHSTDDTVASLRAVSADDPRLIVMLRSSERGGAPVCRNQGLARAAGEFVIFLDSDDLLAPHCLEHRVQFMESNRDLDFAAFSVQVFHQRPGDTPWLFNRLEGDDDLDRFLRRDMPWITHSPIWRRSALVRLGGWDEGLPSWQDWELHIRALCSGLRYRKVNEIDAYYRVHDQPSIGKTGRNTSRYPDLLRLIHRVGEMLNKSGLMTPPRRALLAGNCFRLADAAVRYGQPSQSRPTWRWAFENGWVSYLQYLETAAVFCLNRWAALYRVGRRYLLHRWPVYFEVAGSKTHLKYQGDSDASHPAELTTQGVVSP